MNAPDLLQYGATHSEQVSEETLSHFQSGLFGTPDWPERFEPPLAAAPARIVILCENKLISLDMILPLAFELKGEHPTLKIEFLFLRRDHMAKVKENYILWAGMQAVGEIRFLSYGGLAHSSMFQRAANLIRLVREIRNARRQPTLLFYRKDFSGWPVALLALAVRVGRGALIGFPSIAYPMSSALLRSLLNQEPSTIHHKFQADRQLLFHPLQRREQRRVTCAPMAVIGTTRWFPRWRTFLDTILREQGLRDLDGKPIDAGEKTNILMFYPGNLPLPDLDSATACRDQMVRTLAAIRRVAPQARVLIKPHVICDLTDLKRELDAFRDLDIRITFAHPLALARYSVVCTVPNGTGLIDDMYITGLPLIDTAKYLPEIRDGEGGLFPNRGRVSATADAEIEDAFRTALSTPDAMVKPERGHLYWPKIPSISQLLWRQ